MIWALDLDDFKNICGCEEYPLLRTINRVLRGYRIPDPKCVLGKTQKPMTTSRPTTVTVKPSMSTHKTTSSYEEIIPSYEIVEPDNTLPEVVVPPSSKPCKGMFVSHETNCNQYYLCNQGDMLIQACPDGLFWNIDHCDWPENSQCHPDGEKNVNLLLLLLRYIIHRKYDCTNRVHN